MAKEYFEEWMPSGRKLRLQIDQAVDYNKAAFLLPSGVERLYHTALLV